MYIIHLRPSISEQFLFTTTIWINTESTAINDWFSLLIMGARHSYLSQRNECSAQFGKGSFGLYLRSGVLIARPTTATFSAVDCWFKLRKDARNNKEIVKDRNAFTQRAQGSTKQTVSTRSSPTPDRFAASSPPCLLPANGSDTADNLPPTLLLLASAAFLAELRMANVLRDAGLQGKNHDRTVISSCKPGFDACNVLPIP